MSHWSSEEGTLSLPAAAVTPLKRQLREFTNRLHTDVRARAVKIHKSFHTTSVTAYEKALTERRDSTRRKRFMTEEQEYLSLQEDLACAVLWAGVRRAHQEQHAVRQPTVSDVEHFAPKATSHTTEFAVRAGNLGVAIARISIAHRTVTWSVARGNDARISARNTPMGKVFFRHLEGITWTRGSGGTFVGNDEINQEQPGVGGGGNYLTATYGPLGESARARSVALIPGKYRALRAAMR